MVEVLQVSKCVNTLLLCLPHPLLCTIVLLLALSMYERERNTAIQTVYIRMYVYTLPQHKTGHCILSYYLLTLAASI